MAADDDATNGEQEVLRLKWMSESPHCPQNKKSWQVSTQQAPLFPEQQPLREPISRRSLTTGYEDKENSLSELPAVKHLPQLNKPWLKSIKPIPEYKGSEIWNLKFAQVHHSQGVAMIIFNMEEFQNVLAWAVHSTINQKFDLSKSPRTR